MSLHYIFMGDNLREPKLTLTFVFIACDILFSFLHAIWEEANSKISGVHGGDSFCKVHQAYQQSWNLDVQ